MTLAARGRLDALDERARAHILQRGAPDEDERIRDAAAQIAAHVRREGDAALLDLTRRFDGVALETLEVPRKAWDDALARVDAPVRDALERAHANIRRFHEAGRPQPFELEVVPGVHAGRRIVPYARVGAYVPGGRAAYPSTVLMTVTPAKVAGVPEVVVVTPPGPDGKPHDATLAACAVAGADRVFAIGGAQAIFALAHGTQTIPRVDKIVGPGNAYVAAAKALVAHRVAIDAPAGPSEVLVLADASADDELVAREMLAQAEHDPRAACVALTTDAPLAQRIEATLARLAKDAPRGEVVRDALASRGAVLVAADEAEMIAFAEQFATEHLVLLTREPRATLEKLHNYGSAFLGPHSSVALGDYCSGPNHVLPTGGLARAYNGLGVEDFTRRPTHQLVDATGLDALADTAITLARFEGLPNHAAAVEARRKQP